jgi:NDMA-dependent alcohol dehydrogenase
MRTRVTLCLGVDEPWQVEEIELDPPAATEVVVKMSYAGLCHSDEHVREGDIGADPEMLAELTGGVDSLFPIIGGHEGAGVVEEVGEQVTSVAVGDHVAVAFSPSCGRCFWCATGRQHLCDLTAATLAGPMMSDGQWRHRRADGTPVNRMAQLGTFSEKVLCHELSLVKVDQDLPLRAAAVVSCGIATGFGSSVNRGAVKPGEVAVVIGCGGVGHGALLGAISAGARAIVAVDPVPFKLEKAKQVGATHFAASMEEAMPLVEELTRGRMADVAVITATLLRGEMLAPALSLVSKDGRLVCTAVQRWDEIDAKVSLYELAMFNKAILGSLFGSMSPRASIVSLLDLYRAGKLPLDELITREYPLDQINEGYADLHEGRNIRGLLAFD